MLSHANRIKEKLWECLQIIEHRREEFVVDPSRDFTRSRKISLMDVLAITLGFSGKSISSELLSFFHFSPQVASASAFVQQRDKVLPSAFTQLLYLFNAQCPLPRTYRGYHLLAIDGSDLLIPTDPTDVETYNNAQQIKGFNALSINALYDLLNQRYLDVEIQPYRKKHERAALQTFLSRMDHRHQTIIIGDRGYEGYQVFATFLQQQSKFLIRVTDVTAKTCMLSRLSLLDETFDIDYQRILTRKQTNQVKANPETYKFLPKNASFSYLSDEVSEYQMNLRFVRLKVEDKKYQLFATNLSRDEFPPEAIRELYHLRWGIETSFRRIKHLVGVTHLHSKKRQGMIQEIVAAMVLYNFTSIIASQVSIKQAITKHLYQINFAKAVTICRAFFHRPLEQLEALLAKYLSPVRPGRKHPREVKMRKFASFNYRIA